MMTMKEMNERYRSACVALSLPVAGAGVCCLGGIVVLGRMPGPGAASWRVVPNGCDTVWYRDHCPDLDFSSPTTIGFILDSLVTALAARGKRVTVEQNDLHPPAWRIVVDGKVQDLISHPTQAEAIVAALEAAAGLPKAETR
jgi:hypothetical protein